MPTRTSIHKSPSDFDHDICLSFAGEDRSYVKKVAEGLRRRGVRVFFDEYEKALLWGKDLYVHLDEIYRKSAYYCVLFASQAYANKIWTNHERMSAQARAIQQNEEYILPVRFDDTEIPGLRPTIGYINLITTPPSELVELIITKLGSRVFSNFLPPELDLLHASITPKNKKARARTEQDAGHFFHTLKRMNPEERKLVFQIFHAGCEHELPDNIHVETDLICRDSGFPPSKIRRILNGLYSLGFRFSEQNHESKKSKKKIPVITSVRLSAGAAIVGYI